MPDEDYTKPLSEKALDKATKDASDLDWVLRHKDMDDAEWRAHAAMLARHIYQRLSGRWKWESGTKVLIPMTHTLSWRSEK